MPFSRPEQFIPQSRVDLTGAVQASTSKIKDRSRSDQIESDACIVTVAVTLAGSKPALSATVHFLQISQRRSSGPDGCFPHMSVRLLRFLDAAR